MHARRVVWTMLAVSIYLGLLSAGGGPTPPAQAETTDSTATDVYDCVVVGADGRVTVDPEDCPVATVAASP